MAAVPDPPHDTAATPQPNPTQYADPFGQHPDAIHENAVVVEGRVYGGYQVVELIGRGGMGVVYKATDLTLGRTVALKVMKPELAADSIGRHRFLREAKALAAVRHDHIVTIYQVGEDRGVPFLAMEYLPGQTVAMKYGPYPIREALRIAKETALGLAAMHAAGIIHRDIKPENLWLESPTGRVKILDFGLARTSPEPESAAGSISGMAVGTPRFMSPEQALCRALDSRTDLFSLGIVLYRMLTGILPFDGSTTVEILHAIAYSPPRPITTVILPARLGMLLNQLLAKSPDGRPASAGAVADELAAIDANLHDPDPSVPADFFPMQKTDSELTLLSVRPHKPPRRFHGRVAVIAAVIGAAVTFAAFQVSPPNGDSTGSRSSVIASGAIPELAPMPRLVNPPSEASFVSLFNGKDFTGWRRVGNNPDAWKIENSEIQGWTKTKDDQWLLSKDEYDDFEVRLVYRMYSAASHTTVKVRAAETNGIVTGISVNIGDDEAFPKVMGRPIGTFYQTAAIQYFAPQSPPRNRAPGEWNHLQIIAEGRQIRVAQNGHLLNIADLDRPNYILVDDKPDMAVLQRPRGAIALEAHRGIVLFQNVSITRIRPSP